MSCSQQYQNVDDDLYPVAYGAEVNKEVTTVFVFKRKAGRLNVEINYSNSCFWICFNVAKIQCSTVNISSTFQKFPTIEPTAGDTFPELTAILDIEILYSTKVSFKNNL